MILCAWYMFDPLKKAKGPNVCNVQEHTTAPIVTYLEQFVTKALERWPRTIAADLEFTKFKATMDKASRLPPTQPGKAVFSFGSGQAFQDQTRVTKA